MIAEVFYTGKAGRSLNNFLEGLDSLTPTRRVSIIELQVTARILNQLLSEIDGFEELRAE